MPIVESHDPPNALYRVADIYDVYDLDTAAVLDQLLAHIQALTVVSLGLLAVPGLYAVYDLPNEDPSRAVLATKLEHEISVITQTLREMAHFDLGSGDRARLAHALRDRVPYLREFAPTPEERASQAFFLALTKGELAPPPAPIAPQRLTQTMPRSGRRSGR
jgi:hypothetical protein